MTQQNSYSGATAPAAHAAAILLKNFDVSPVRNNIGILKSLCGRTAEIEGSGEIPADVQHIGAVIDLFSSLPRLVPALNSFVDLNPWYEPPRLRPRGKDRDDGSLMDFLASAKPEAPDGGKSQRLEDNLDRLRDCMRQLEQAGEALPPLGESLTIPSALARSVTERVLKLFNFNRQISRTKLTERNIAIIIDTSTELFRIHAAIWWMTKRSPWMDQTELRRNLSLIREGLAATEFVRNHLPVRMTGANGYVIKDVDREPPRLSPLKQAEVREFNARRQQARTPREEFQIISNWRQHNNVHP